MSRLIPLATATLAVAAAAAPTSAHAASFGCTAQAVTGTVLGQPVGGAQAGDPITCSDQQAGSGLTSVLTERTADGAKASSSVSGLSVGRLTDLQALAPRPELPAGLGAVPLPITNVLGVAETVSADFRPAVQALLRAAPLPDVPLLQADLVRAVGEVACTAAGLLTSTADTAVRNLRAAGEQLTGGTPLTLAPARTIDLAQLDPAKVVLPAGLSLDAPVVGPLLRAAILDAAQGLQDVDVPALLGRAAFTPGSRSEDASGITQDAGRVVLDVAGKTVADLTLGLVRLTGVCDQPATVKAAAPQGPVAPASQLAVACADAPVTLVDVAEHKDGHVSLLGAAKADAVGRRVQIVFAKTGKVVATGTVRPDGFFRAKAPLPARAVRRTNDARYVAVLDGQRSLALKLHRRMRIAKLSDRGDTVQLTGRINGPLAPGEKIVVRRKVTCDSDVVVQEVTPGKDGTWRATLPAPTDAQAAVYRATTQVRAVTGSAKTFPTFSLPGYVSLR